jgi:hypothetical protein
MILTSTCNSGEELPDAKLYPLKNSPVHRILTNKTGVFRQRSIFSREWCNNKTEKNKLSHGAKQIRALENYLTPRLIFLLHASIINNKVQRLRTSNQINQDEKFKETGTMIDWKCRGKKPLCCIQHHTPCCCIMNQLLTQY